MFAYLLSFPALPLAGRLQHFLPAWEQIIGDPWVFQFVSGYQIQFLDNPVCMTILASPTLVPPPTGPMRRLLPSPASPCIPVDPREQNTPSQLITPSWVTSVKRYYQASNVSEQRHTLTEAWRTPSAYYSAWTQWRSWCGQWVNINPLSPSLTIILDLFASQSKGVKSTEQKCLSLYTLCSTALDWWPQSGFASVSLSNA